MGVLHAQQAFMPSTPWYQQSATVRNSPQQSEKSITVSTVINSQKQSATVRSSPQQSATVRKINNSQHSHKQSETVRNSPQQSETISNSPQQSGTVRNSPQQSATVRNSLQQSATVRNNPQQSATVSNSQQQSALFSLTNAVYVGRCVSVCVFVVCAVCAVEECRGWWVGGCGVDGWVCMGMHVYVCVSVCVSGWVVCWIREVQYTLH
jgi:hypothetical protein